MRKAVQFCLFHHVQILQWILHLIEIQHMDNLPFQDKRRVQTWALGIYPCWVHLYETELQVIVEVMCSRQLLRGV